LTRNRRSAKQAGSSLERSIADCLSRALDDDRIDRRVKTGSKDRGDIAGLRLRGQRVVVEVKNIATGKVLHLPEWVKEAQIEAGNDDALLGIVVHKRSGTTDPLEQWCTFTVRDFIALLTGEKQRHGSVAWHESPG
jgi:hypothetical protein